MTAISRRPPREFVDFASVPPSQWAIHDRLTNWARWCRGRQGQVGGAGSPMFELYRSSNARREYGEETSVPVDTGDAVLLAKTIGNPAFPDQHRRALDWYYVHPRNPGGKAREMGLSIAGLADLVQRARIVLMNRL